MISTPFDSESNPDLDAEFWEQRYQDGTARWDLGQPAPPFLQLLLASDRPPPGRMVVLGMGRGHDALLFASYGFEVVGVDFAPSAIASATALAAGRGLKFQALERDIFALEAEFAGEFDYVLEHTCFCAIAPQQRPAYVKLVRSLLKPTGEFIGLFWAHRRPGGPPFGTSLAELCTLFEPEFTITALTQATNSIPNRANEEYLARFPRRTASSYTSQFG